MYRKTTDESIRSYLKNASNAQWLCCQPPQNAHILLCMPLFFEGNNSEPFSGLSLFFSGA